MVETSDEWITTRTGIKARHVAAEDESTAVLGAKAAKAALAESSTTPAELDCIIVATGSPDMLWPSSAVLIQNLIAADNAAAFDLSAACTGFVYALDVASAMIAAGSAEKVMVIGAEAITKFIDWSDRNTCVLFGDAAAATVIGPALDETGVVGSVLAADGSRSDILKIPAGGSAEPASETTVAQRRHFIKMSGHEVFKFAVQVIPQVIEDILIKYELSMDEVRWFVPHQANQRIIESAATKLGVDPERWFNNIAGYGNTSSASIPLALDELRRSGKLVRGDVVVTVGFGAGLTWGANLIIWS